MPRVNWSFDVSLGNLISVLTTVVVVTAAWTTLRNDQTNMTVRLDKLELRVAEGERKDEARDAVVMGEKLRISETLAELKTELRYMRSTLDDLARQRAKGAN